MIYPLYYDNILKVVQPTRMHCVYHNFRKDLNLGIWKKKIENIRRFIIVMKKNHVMAFGNGHT